MSGYLQVGWGILKGKTIKLITGFVVFEILVFPNLPPIFTFRILAFPNILYRFYRYVQLERQDGMYFVSVLYFLMTNMTQHEHENEVNKAVRFSCECE